MSETMSLAAVKARFSELVERVARQHDRVVVTRNGRPAAVLVSPDDIEGLEETLAILSDTALRGQVHEGLAAMERGELATLDDVQADLEARRTPGS